MNLRRQNELIPNHYFGWVIILLAFLRLFNKADISIRWKFAFAAFMTFYSLGKLAVAFISAEIAGIFYILSAATVLIPFLRLDYPFKKDAERISEASLFLSIGIIILLS
jgi:hypothetical protein